RGGASAPPGFQPAPRALLGRGHAAPRPLGLRPLCALRHTGPPSGRSGKGWVGARGVGNACVVHAPQQPPVQHQKGKFKKIGGARPQAAQLGPVGMWSKAGQPVGNPCGQAVGSLLSTGCPAGLSTGRAKRASRCPKGIVHISTGRGL
ncbi:hypothetical protein D9614_25300, partial [Shigella dysenteriae]|nr:hypothetical protein [Shigella dysenteriae]